ncbi:CLUMA_CG012029, isoform A [Clunio marinus]|uniref:G patch domain-containing protein 11 n=1 Tax=Clunio marinus TaxID=568069 RepID=A0A1J1IGT3_9DIPT|nr:CLUMA_CG012029, isoform A [Clunio marinus]
MSDEEEDYMSDAFLAKLQDVTPSLINNSAVKRRNEIETKKKEQQGKHRYKPVREMQNEKLKEGLNKAITSDNKGFAMLSKMGFKPGTSLGKSSQATAITEPIKINLNTDGRMGLGTQTAVKEHRERQLSNLKRKMDAADLTPEEYRKQMREAADKKQIVWDLHKLQKTCRILDLEKNVKFPIHPWFWPKDFSKKDDSSEEDEEEINNKEKELTDSERLEMLRKFLRASYFYCEYCGHQYKDGTDFMNGCPGPSKDDH